MQINYYINGQEVNRPLNYKELSIELNFDKDKESQALSLTEFEFGLGSQIDDADAATLINEHLEAGLFFEGLPFEIELTNNGTTYTLFDGYLDLSTALFDCDRVILQGVEKKSVDWLNDVADSKTFQYIYEVENIILDSDFVNIPYVLSELPNGKEALLTSVSMFFIVQTISGEVEDLIEKLAATGLGSIWDAVQLILRVIYIVGLIILLVKLLREILELVIQPIKYHTAMSELKHCQRASESFGYTFSSSILESEPFVDSYILPEKYFMEEGETTAGNYLLGNNNKAIKSTGFFKGTVGDFFRALKIKYNAKIIIDGNILRLERRDYNNSAYNYVIPPVDQTDYKLNSDELKSNYTVSFSTDINDKNTILNYEGVSTQVITSPLFGRTDYTLLKGLEENLIPFARGKRKTEYTAAENIARTILPQLERSINTLVAIGNTAGDVVSAGITSGFSPLLTLLGINVFPESVNIPVIGTVQLTPPQIPTVDFSGFTDNRLGVLTMENDFIDVPKNIIFEINSDASNTKVSPLDDIANNSLFLYDNYHFIESFIPTDEKPNANQYKIYEVENVPFCFNEYELVRSSNFCQDSDNKDGEIISLKWNPEKEKASINYKINELYTDKLIENKITPNGE